MVSLNHLDWMWGREPTERTTTTQAHSCQTVGYTQTTLIFGRWTRENTNAKPPPPCQVLQCVEFPGNPFSKVQSVCFSKFALYVPGRLDECRIAGISLIQEKRRESP